MKSYKISQLEPFGIVVESVEKCADVTVMEPIEIRDLVVANRVVVFRGFERLDVDAFPQFCSRFGKVLEFDFGVVNELRASPDATNYLYTNAEVPFHWDGAFIGKIPRYIFFHCDDAPASGSGGETLFTDTTLMLKAAPAEKLAKWREIEITYSTDKVVHYGGSFSSAMIGTHPDGDERVIRYAEPVMDLNPVRLEIRGIGEGERDAFLSDMHARLNDERVCYQHAWEAGDILVADNHSLLHGRRGFDSAAKRRIRRVNIQ